MRMVFASWKSFIAPPNTQQGRQPRIHQAGRQPRRRGAAKAASTNRQPNQAARRRGQRLDDSGTQAQGRRHGRAEESQQDHAQGHSQDASDDARPVLDGVGHSADQSVEPRSRHMQKQTQTYAEKCGKRDEDTHEDHHSCGHIWA